MWGRFSFVKLVWEGVPGVGCFGPPCIHFFSSVNPLNLTFPTQSYGTDPTHGLWVGGGTGHVIQVWPKSHCTTFPVPASAMAQGDPATKARMIRASKHQPHDICWDYGGKKWFISLGAAKLVESTCGTVRGYFRAYLRIKSAQKNAEPGGKRKHVLATS